MLLAHKLILVTLLLLGLSYKILTVSTAFCIFGITVAATYICYALNTQLKLEKYLKYVKHVKRFIGIAESKSEPPDEQDFQVTHTAKHDGLRSFPKPIAKMLDRYITSILRDFVESWYVVLGPDETDFLEEARIAMEHITGELNTNLRAASIPNATVNLIHVFQRHIKTFDECQSIIQKKYPNLPEDDFAMLISELYEEAVVPNVATRSKGTELDYLKSLVDILLHKFLPSDTFSCLSGRFLLREVLAIQCLEPLMQIFTDAHFINEIVIDILEPSVPLSTIMNDWELALKEFENEVEEEDQLSIGNTPENEDSPETAYESTNEQELKVKISAKKSGKHKNRKSRGRSKSKRKLFSIPDDSSPEVSDTNEETGKELIRFDKLDMKTSYPVYGSTSARDHEKSGDKLHLPLPKHNHDALEPLDSGRASLGREPSPSEDDAAFESPVKENGGWAFCPSSRAEVFRHPSFYGMPLKQDSLSEQFKARVSAGDLSNMIRRMPPINCLDPCLKKGQALSDSSLDMLVDGHIAKNLENSVDGSVTIEFGKKQQRPYASTKDNSKTNDETKSVEDVVKVHKSGESGAFYEIAPSCPTCIEMTSLASPFQSEKAQVVLSEKEIKEREKKEGRKIVFEHECGLDSEHFCNQQAETESITVDPLVDQESFPFSPDLIHNEISDNSVSSGTLLASGETFEEEESDKCSNEDAQTSSFDNISELSYGSRSDFSQDSSLEYEVIPAGLRNKRKLSRAASIQTFKTAIEGSVLDENTRLRSSSSTSLEIKQRKSTLDRQFFQFFKKGIRKLPSRKFRSSDSSKKEKESKGQTFRKILKGKRHFSRNAPHPLLEDEFKIETSSQSTSPTKFNSLPEYPSSVHTHWRDPKELVEEGLEVDEEEEIFENDLTESTFLPATVVDPLSKEIAVTDKDLPNDAKSVKSVESKSSNPNIMAGSVNPGVNDGVHEPGRYIPIYEGEVIMPHPSKLPAAWLYPIQMLSIPTTEVAYEKGWEPGINKYTLYIIHYDIRIWPDLYQKQLLEANSKVDSVPLIREIKRRYKEFLLIHNRITHGALSKFMKGVLRPNRRYAMPFGRMDPDVIEGRRKILETYLVSLVSRPELCNSREFKDFLGFEDNDEVSVLKPKIIEQKRVYKSQAKSTVPEVKSAHALQVAPKETEKLGMNSPYFIHGYEIPRMFGYADEDLVHKHSKLLLSHFVLNYPHFKHAKDKEKESAKFETILEPVVFHPSVSAPLLSSVETSGRATPVHPLGQRTAGDGAESPDIKHELINKETLSAEKGNKSTDSKKYEGSVNPSIAAKFSEELAAKLQEERKHLASRIAHEKSLYQSSWPLTDAVLSIVSQILKGYRSWLSFEKVQQAILFSLGGLIEWLINIELEEVGMKERCYKYLKDLYTVLWDENDCLRPSKPAPTEEEKKKMKEKCLKRVMEFIPSFVRLSVGRESYRHCCTKLVNSLQYERINRHVLYASLEVILNELIPECAQGYPRYVTETKHL